MIGLATALLLAAEGVDVIVLDRDDATVPDSAEAAWAEWGRPGVSQFRQPHFLLPHGFHLVEQHLPDLAAAFREHGTAFDYMSLLPASVADRAPREGDERFRTVTARRPVLEYAAASHAQTKVDIRRGVTVVGLVKGTPVISGVPNVTGVRTSSGETLAADLVIDATGRRSALPAWLSELGSRPVVDEVEDLNFIYYTRFFRSRNGGIPAFPSGRLLAHFDCYSLLTLPSDADTWSVSVYVSARDQALKELRHVPKWTTLVRACARHAHLLDGEPLTDIRAMSGVADRWRHVSVDGAPLVTGIVPVGDSACNTNPALGRGITLGLTQATGLVDIVTKYLDAPAVLAQEHDLMMRERVLPWYRDTVTVDRARYTQIDHVIRGTEAPRTEAGQAMRALAVAMTVDADAFRALTEIVTMVSFPDEVFRRPGLAARLQQVADGLWPAAPPGPERAEVLRMLG